MVDSYNTNMKTTSVSWVEVEEKGRNEVEKGEEGKLTILT